MLADPMVYQRKLLKQIIKANAQCAYGKKYNFGAIKTIQDYKSALPIVHYSDLYADIENMMDGQPNLLVSEEVQWFAKSSGTTNAQSKYIPVTSTYLTEGHLKCTWVAASVIYNEDPTAKLFANKNLIMGGSLTSLPKGITVGDISAIMLHHFPKIGRRFATPDFEIALMDDWDAKIKLIAMICSQEQVTLFGGVPTWSMVLMKELIHHTGAENICDIWPSLRSYIHGGIGFEPYRSVFRKYMPSDKVVFREVYNASEGYFAIQNEKDDDGMILLCDHQIFYEFIPYAQLSQEYPDVLLLDEVELGYKYALVITNSAGLYRYKIGDVVQIVSVRPYKIKVVGRTEQYINVFGEEVMISNTDTAIAKTANMHKAEVKEYTVGPIYLSETNKGGHEWAIEFITPPALLHRFAKDLDTMLQSLNSDYAAKRTNDLAMKNLVINAVSQGTFEYWQRRHRKYGKQYKMIRLSNERKVLEEIIALC